MNPYCPYCMTPVPEGETCPVCGLTSGTYPPSPITFGPGRCFWTGTWWAGCWAKGASAIDQS